MASISKYCSFCHDEVDILQNGWCLKDCTYAQLCPRCFEAYEEGSFCHLYHKDEDGWRKCDDCDRLVHCGCIMALRTFEVNDTSGITCKECINRRSLSELNDGASLLVPYLKDGFQLEDRSSSTEICTEKQQQQQQQLSNIPPKEGSGEVQMCATLPPTGECLADPGKENPLNYDLQNPGHPTPNGTSEVFQLPKSGLLFLFEKKMKRSDCDPRTGRILVPKQLAEAFFPLAPGQRSMPVSIQDTEGRSWKFTFRSWMNKNSRKYVFDGTRRCLEAMGWTIGDTLKIYRKYSDGSLMMKVERTGANSSGSIAPVTRDERIKQ